MARNILKFCSGGCGRERVAGPDFFTEKVTGRPRSRCKHCMTKDSQRWNRNNPEKHKAIYRKHNHRLNLRKRFGITVEEFDALFSACSGVCGICRNPESRDRRLSLDHDHKTGELRGFVCSKCNLLIGGAKDDAALLRAAAEYLDKPPLKGK